MKGHRVVKPVVEFSFVQLWEQWGDKHIAVLKGVRGHPRLDNQDVVFTSEVLSADNYDSPTLIETLNTIYKKQS